MKFCCFHKANEDLCVVMSVLPHGTSRLPEERISWNIFHEISDWDFFPKFVDKFSFS